MAILTGPRRSRPVDIATRPLVHSFRTTFRKNERRGGLMETSTTYTGDELLEDLLPDDHVLFNALAAEYKRENMLLKRVNASPAGGGVAIMNMVLGALFSVLGLPFQWRVQHRDQVAAVVTKRVIHNRLQGMRNPPPIRQYSRKKRGFLIAALWLLPFIGRWCNFPLAYEGVACTTETISRTDRLIYRRWVSRCWRQQRWALAEASHLIVDDWQPSRFIKYMRGRNLSALFFMFLRILRGRSPRVVIFFRDHIETNWEAISKNGTPGNDTWRYLWFKNQIFRADKFLVHLPEFAPPYVPEEMLLVIPATSDMKDEHNRPMTEEEERDALGLLNGNLIATGQLPIDPSDTEKLMGLIARFCPAKGMIETVQIVARSIQIMHYEMGLEWHQTSEILIFGNGAPDDRDGVQVYADVLAELSNFEPEIARRIRVLRLPHCDMIKNVIMKLCKLGIQYSLAEGMENCVTDWEIGHLTPCFVGLAGGPKVQIVDGESGLKMDPYDTEYCARQIVRFFTDEAWRTYMYERVAFWAPKLNLKFTTPYNALRWLALCVAETRRPGYAGNNQHVDDRVLAKMKSDFDFAA